MLRRAVARGTRQYAAETTLRRAAVALQRRAYQGNLQDKDRIFTNLYNDSSPYLEGARKRVRAPPSLPRPRRMRPSPPRAAEAW